MKKKGLMAALLCACILVITGSVYVFLSLWYEGVFPAFMWIDGEYVTGKTVQEVNQSYLERHPYEGINVVDISGAELFIRADEIDMEYTYEPALNMFMELRGGFNWWQVIYRKKDLGSEMFPYITFDEEKLDYILRNWEALTSYEDLYANIEKTDEGYILDNNYKNMPDVDNIVFYVTNAVFNLDKEIILVECNDDHPGPTYSNIEDILQYDHEDLVSLFGKIDDVQHKDISFNLFDETISLSTADLSKFIVTGNELEDALSEERDKDNDGKGLFIVGGVEKEISDEDSFYNEDGFILDETGNLLLSESRMYDYANILSDKYTTGWCMDQYRSGVSDSILVRDGKKGDGCIIDRELVFETIKSQFLSGSFADTVEPSDSDDGTVVVKKYDDFFGTDDSGSDYVDENNGINILMDGVKQYSAKELLGDTYIEVDMNKQHLYYYVDGALNMDMPVVTGNVNRGRATPVGIFNVYNKRYHTYLRGVGYVSYVNYWLGVNKGVGIHDANWRSEFGDEIYKRDGSHGCINCPEESVEKLWEVCEVGTPVILHY